MNPTVSDVHINTPLTNISIAFLQSIGGFVADRAFPLVPVEKKSDSYFTFDRGDFNRNQMKKRAPSTESAGGGYRISPDSYNCEVFALHKDIDDQIRANSDSALNPDRNATEWLVRQALIQREVAWATDFFTTGIWTTDITGVASAPGASQVLQWNDGGSTPVENVRAARSFVLQSTGFAPNKLILGRLAYDALADHPDIMDRVKYGQTAGAPAMVTPKLIAQLLDLDEVLIMDSIQNTAKEGAAASHSFIGGKKALLLYAPSGPSLEVPSAGYTFGWRGYLGGQFAQAISRFRMDELKSDRVEIETAYDQKKVSADLGYFFTSIVG